MPDFHFNKGITLTDSDIAEIYANYPLKFVWFAQNGYKPHYWQLLFHGNSDPDTHNLCRFRHLVAGRRGGKTLSAAWEVVFYALHPEVFHRDAHGEDSKKPLHIWVLTKDYPTGMAALLAVRHVLEMAGCEQGREYKENKGNRWFEFENGTFLQFKTADDPESLRGAGLDILWMDEAAFIPSSRPWEVVRPALAEKVGMLITSTTPDGKNWLYDEFWTGHSTTNTAHGRVEYRSIDNPYFPTEEWQALQRSYHPLLFKQEFMASFDSMAGKELAGDWLKYYEMSELEERGIRDTNYGLSVFLAVDPAISLKETADRFAITAVGVTKDRHQVYLLDQWAGRIPFPEQVDKIYEWFQKYRPHYIAIESVAYQAALGQQLARLEGFPPVATIFTKGKKFERILAMSPLFRIGKVKIRRDHVDFINEWVDYDSELRNPKDDCLDSMEIALRAAGVLLPGSNTNTAPSFFGDERAAGTADDWLSIASARHPKAKDKDQRGVDIHLGQDW